MSISKKIVRVDSLSTDRLDGKYDDDLIICPICTNILWKPIACKTCENSFCLKCIRLWLNEKPNQCPFNCHFIERKPPGILLKLLSKLKLDCSNKLNGCNLLISYEALEKHQLEECQYRLIQCENCLKEMLFKDLDIHQKNDCEDVQLTCLKCSTVYYKKDGHQFMDCLKKHIDTMDDVLKDINKDPKLVTKSYKQFLQLYDKLKLNEEYAKDVRSQKNTNDYIIPPSAPFEEPQSPLLSSQNLPVSTIETNSMSSNESLRISTINFNHLIVSKKEGGHIPNGYAAFNWENAHYMFKEHALKYYQLKGFLNSFTKSINCVAYNGNGNSLSIFLSNSQNKFSLHSFEAISIYYQNLKLSLHGYRSNQIIYVKHIILNTDIPQLFEIDFQQIDKITFTTVAIHCAEGIKPSTFALIRLNFIF